MGGEGDVREHVRLYRPLKRENKEGTRPDPSRVELESPRIRARGPEQYIAIKTFCFELPQAPALQDEDLMDLMPESELAPEPR